MHPTERKEINIHLLKLMKRINLGLGGESPAVVFEDAKHLDSVAEHVVDGAFWNMGENRTAN